MTSPQRLLAANSSDLARPTRPGGRSITRRSLMQAAAGTGIAAVGIAGRGLILPWMDFPRVAAAAEFLEPPVRTSSNGLLDTTITCRVMSVPVAGQMPVMAVYEGSSPGPTLRVKPGDRLRINLVNQLGDLPPGLPAKSPFNCSPLGSGHEGGEMVTTCDTNLHLHGLHVSPEGNSDNIFLRVPAGESFQYEYAIPGNHPAGLGWYHPHLHGATNAQVFGGLAAALIVEGEIDELPGIAGVPERLMVLQATQFEPGSGGGKSVVDMRNSPPTGPAHQAAYIRMVNGQVNPTMTMRPGETQRWRIVNAAANATFFLRLDGHQLHQVAKDGNTLAETWTRDAIVMAPGERIEVLVQAGSAGTYTLRTLPFATGFTTMKEDVLATVVVDGTPMTPAPLPTALLPVEDLAAGPVDGHRQFTFQFGTPIDQYKAQFWINHQVVDPNRDDAVVHLNTTEEWVIRNATSQWHPFHIHINDYQVTAINGKPVPLRSREDTTGVPPFGELTMRTRFLDFTGRWVFHCHILMHEDHGMMATVRGLA